MGGNYNRRGILNVLLFLGHLGEALCSYLFDAQKGTQKRAPWLAFSFCLRSLRGRILPASLPCLAIKPWHNQSFLEQTSVVIKRPAYKSRLSRGALTFAWPIEGGQNPPLNRAKGERASILYMVQTHSPPVRLVRGRGLEGRSRKPGQEFGCSTYSSFPVSGKSSSSSFKNCSILCWLSSR